MNLSELKRRYRDGTPVEILAELSGCTILEVLFALGLTQPSKSMSDRDKQFLNLYTQGKVDVQIAKEANCSKSLVHQWRTKYGLPSNGEIDKELWLDLYEQGLYDTQIAKIAGCSQSAVHKWRVSAGLPSNFKRRNKL